MKYIPDISIQSVNFGRKEDPDPKIAGKHDMQYEMSCRHRPPRQPDRQRSLASKNPTISNTKSRRPIDGREEHLKDEVRVKCDSHLTSACSSTPCTSVYCSSDDDISGRAAGLTEDQIRAFLHDYYTDYDALRDEQNLDTWTCFAEQYYCPNFQFVRPSGNPIGVDALVRGLASDMRIKSIQMVSIDSITILSSSTSAIVVYTCDHSFEFKGTPCEDRGVMTCVLEFVRGGIKIIHEHRSSGRPIPRESRWQSESYIPEKEK